MKRSMKIIMYLMMVLFLVMPMSFSVFAEEQEIYEESATKPFYYAASNVSYSIELEQKIVDALMNVETKVDIRGFGISRTEVSDIVFHIMQVHPEVFYVSNRISWSYSSTEVVSVSFEYLNTKEEIKQMKKEIDDAVNELMKQIDRDVMSDLEIVLTVHDYFATTMEYNTDTEVNRHMYDMYGALVMKKPVCQGYSEAFMYVMSLLDIPSAFVSSDQSIHAWNAVQIDGKWYHLDITADDPLTNQLARVRHAYFLLSTETLLAKDQNRSDFIVETPRGVKYQEAVHKNYETGYVFNDATARVYVFDGNWYYINGSNQLMKHNPKTKTEELVVSLRQGWYYGRLYPNEEMVYVSDGYSVSSVDLKTKQQKTLVVKDASNFRLTIIGVGEENGYLAYQVEDSSSGYTNYRIIPTDIHLDHQWKTISDHVFEQVQTCTVCNETRQQSVDVARVKGKDRFYTSLEIADAFKEVLGVSQFDTVILANGRDFADALAGSYLAAVKNAPILMVDNKNQSKMSMIKDYLAANMNPSGTVYILGGEAAVPAFAETELSGYNVTRLKGKNRYGTNLAILAEAGVTNQPILVCNAKNFADSLSASATGLPMLLVGNSLNAEQKAFLEAHRGNAIYVLGGEAAVTTDVENALKAYGTVERIKGKSRYETTIEIAKKFFPEADTVVMAYAKNFPDGLCGGPLAYAMKAPLILSATGNSVAANYTTSKGIKSGAVLGGDTLISDESVKNALGKVPVQD